jgi:hypothetical protein
VASQPSPSRRVRVAAGATLVLLAAACAGAPPVRQEAATSQPPTDADEPTVLGSVEVHTRDIFADEDAERSLLARIVNATHATTRVAVVRRELWIAPGEEIRPSEAQELERNLRATGLFAEVRVSLRPTEVAGVSDLVIETEDRLSLNLGASGSFVGAVTSLGASFSESNLFGTGDRIAVAFSENSEDEFRGAVSYRDRHFLGSWVSASAQVGRTEEGEFAALGFERPFKYLADDHSWRISASTTENAVDYYEAGETVAEVPQERQDLDAAVFRRFGPADESWTVGLRARQESATYGAARGPAAGTIDVPEDFDTFFGGVSGGYRRIFGFRKVRGLDTLEYVQDLTLSTGAELVLGAQHRAEEGASDEVQPTVGVTSHLAVEPAPDTYLSLRVSGSGRTEAGELQGWFAGLDATVFALAFAPHTLAAHLAFDEAFEGEGLPVQLTLGEDSGLRGYPAREFTGGRVLRLNFEDRIDFGARLGVVEIGGVVFADVGWIEDRGEGFGRPLRSAGVGLRIGSDSLLGSRVLRLDLSFPLDDPNDEDYGPLVSLSLGQVFEFR